MSFDCIFWDNDGVLVDTETLYFQASREALALIGCELTTNQFTEVSLGSGRSVFELGTGDPLIMEELRRWRNRRYSELLAGRNLLLPGVGEALQRLAVHKKMAVVTSSRRDHFEVIHAGTKILHHFAFILCREDYREAKPDPEAYLLAVQRSGREASRCLVIEDSARGLAAAKGAGLTCWVIPSAHWGGQDLAAADRLCASVGEVAELLGAQG